MSDYDLIALSDPAKDQYFLTDQGKLQIILDAAGIRETDAVVEIGAGAGTVARALPKCASLTLIELDDRLIPTLRENAPGYATILNADGLAYLRDEAVETDVILANLPGGVAIELGVLLPALNFRVAVVAAPASKPFRSLPETLESEVLTEMQGSDFTPPQPGVSVLLCIRSRSHGCQ